MYSTRRCSRPCGESLATDKPLRWNRVNYVPDFVFFNHSIHVSKGIGCSTCHGQVDQMPLMWKAHTLYMKWCLDCHRTRNDSSARAKKFSICTGSRRQTSARKAKSCAEYHVNTAQLTDCSMCHR